MKTDKDTNKNRNHAYPLNRERLTVVTWDKS
ncbi:hypothetical protein T01_7255 [Trichinella spiralis]|uniref:Uncharacterized protein n=1 Tax=Trichinella spiralis TaxID=6334 RepID=A0A0V1AKJ5_TRISP|nr:hypothetical protein T01_7255 [Trichinella spiralis]